MCMSVISRLLRLIPYSLGIEWLWAAHVSAQLPDQTQTPNTAERSTP